MSYSHKDLSRIWDKARITSTHNSNHARKDSQGNWIVWAEYGKQTEHGWEVDHIKPVSKGGTNALSNLQPLHWRANRAKADQ